MKILIVLLSILILTGCGDKKVEPNKNENVNNNETNEVIKEETSNSDVENKEETEKAQPEATEKEEQTKEETDKKEESNKKEETNSTTNNKNNATNKTESTNKNNNTNNNSTSTQKTINLIGTWKLKDDKSYYVFNADGTGKAIDDRLDTTVEFNITWSLKGLNLTTKFPGYEGQFGGTSKLVVYNNDSFNLDTKKNLVYVRYNGELPNRKIYQKMVNFNVNYINMPSGLEFVYNYQKDAQFYMSASSQDLLNQTYEMTIDLSNCGIGTCTVKPQFNTPAGMTFLSSIVDHSYELRKKIISKDVEFETTYINLAPGLEILANSQGNTNIMRTVISDDINKINNAKYTAIVDVASCTIAGQCEGKATYKIDGEGVEMMYGNTGTPSFSIVNKQ